MTRYSTANGDSIEVVLGDDESLSLPDQVVLDVSSTQRGAEGVFQSDEHLAELQQIFDDETMFNIVVEPSGESRIKQYEGCTLKTPTEWECVAVSEK